MPRRCVERICEALMPVPVVVAGRADADLALPSNGINLRRMSLTELIWLIRRAAFTVSVDSGPMHIASAITSRLLGIHTWSDPRRVGPYNLEAWIWKAKQIVHRPPSSAPAPPSPDGRPGSTSTRSSRPRRPARRGASGRTRTRPARRSEARQSPTSGHPTSGPRSRPAAAPAQSDGDGETTPHGRTLRTNRPPPRGPEVREPKDFRCRRRARAGAPVQGAPGAQTPRPRPPSERRCPGPGRVASRSRR